MKCTNCRAISYNANPQEESTKIYFYEDNGVSTAIQTVMDELFVEWSCEVFQIFRTLQA